MTKLAYYNISSLLYEVSKSDNIIDLGNSITNACRVAGFISFNISCNKVNVYDFMTAPDLTTWTSEDLEGYVNGGFLETDPLLAHIAATNTPLCWDADSLKDISSEEYLEMIGDRGILGGATIPLPGREGTFSAMTFLSSPDAKIDKIDQFEIAKIVAYTASLKIPPIFNSSPMGEKIGNLRHLSGIQIEILGWVSEGKSNSDIANILDVSKKRVDYHVSEIIRKLEVSTRIQAAIVYSICHTK